MTMRRMKMAEKTPEVESSGSAPETHNNEATLEDNEFQELLGYDPFEDSPPKDEGSPDPKPAPEADSEGGEPAIVGRDAKGKFAKKDEPKAADPKVAAGTEPQDAEGKILDKTVAEAALKEKELEELKSRLTIQDSQLKTLSEQVAIQHAQQPETQPGEVIPIPDYTVRIPDKLLDMLRSENPEEHRQGLAAVVQGTAQTVHRQVMTAAIAHVNETVPLLIQTQIGNTQTQAAVAQDFYTTYPQYNNPAAITLVVNEAAALAAETGISSWSPEFRDAVAARVDQVIQGFRPTAGAPAPAKAGGTAPAGKPPAMSGGGTRPAGAGEAGAGANSQHDIMDTLFS
jgi:hypothetical protein